MKKAVIGFWYSEWKYCGECIIELDNFKTHITNEHIEKARTKITEMAKFLDRDVLPYIKNAKPKIYNVF